MSLTVGISFATFLGKIMTLVRLNNFLLTNGKSKRFFLRSSNILVTIHEERF